MGRDGIIVGVRIIRKFVVRPAIICFRSVYNHPFLVGVFLMLLYLYRSFPFLFQLLVSASPVLLCTAVLLGTLLSFGDHNVITLIEEDEEKTHEISELKTGMLESSTVVVKDECSDDGGACKEFKSDIVERSFEEEPLLDINEKARDYESHGDIGISSVNSCYISREIEFEKQSIGEAVNYLNSQKIGIEVDVNLSLESVDETPLTAENMHSENFEGLKSEEGSANVQTGDHLESFMEDVSRDMFSSTPGLVVKADNLENHITAEKSIDDQIRDRLESSSGSWTQFDVLEDELSSVKKIRVDHFEDYISGEGSLDAQIGSPLELSLGSWNHLDSDRDMDNESDSGSDGAESSSPDASMADIIPMLDELHPLLEDENPNTSNLSHHSNDESDQQEDEEAGDVKSDGDDDNEEEAQDGKEDSAKSAIKWTEEDEKNLMELGTSELERNQRLESLIARRRARRTVNERNLLDLEGMDLSFPVAPILTTRYNPFDNGHDSYADLGLPPIPGSAPSIMVQRRNPFDLPYDSSEEKPDLTGDSFQEEFMELSQRESTNLRMFKRNETFSVGSSIFDFGRQTTRPSRFRPYFVPERTDDMMSYSSFERQYSELSESRMSSSSLQRQSSELSESKASSTALSPKVGDPSDYEEHVSQCSDDIRSLSYEGDDTEDVDDSLPVIEVGQPTDIREDVKGNYLEVDYGLSERELGSNEVQFVGELLEINHSSSSSLSVPKENNGVKDEDHDRGLVDNQVHNLEHVDISDNYCLDTSMSDIPTNQSHKELEFRLEAKADESLPKEPIYDSSPLAIKRNSSHSSNCSDLQRETSEIDLYHVQRDLFGEDESKFHVKDNEDNDPQRQQEPNDSRCSMNDVTEVTDSTGSHFTELNPSTSSSLALPVGEYVFASSKDSSASGVLKEELLKDKILPNEVEQAFTQGDTTEGHHAGKLDGSIADMSFDDGYKSSVDLLFAQQEEQFVSSSDSNLSSLEGELKEEAETKIGESEHFLTTNSLVNNHDNDASKELLFALDESHFLPHDSLIYDPQKQVQPAIHTNLQEFSQVNKVGENAKILKVQEPEDKMLTSLLQNDESFSQLETLEKVSVSEIAVEKSIQDKYSEEHDNTTQEDELAEDLLSELDAVGDFSLKSIPLSLNKSYLDAESNSDVPEEALAEVHCSPGIQFGDSTSVIDNADVQNYEFGNLTSKPNLAWNKESTSDSHMRDVSAVEFAQAEGIIVNESNIVSSKESIPDLHIEDANIDVVTLEDQSVKENHVAFQKASKEDAQEPVDTEFIQDELTMEEVESTKPMSQTTIAVPVNENTLNDEKSVTARTEFNLALPEEHILDSSRMEPESGVSVGTKNFEDLEIKTNKSSSVEALEVTAESGIGFEESRALHVDTDISDVQASQVMEAEDIIHILDSPVMETVTAPTVEFVDQIERSGSMDLKFLVNSTVVEVGTSNSLELVEPKLERAGSIEPESLEKDRDVRETQESPVLDSSISPAVEFVQQQGRHSSIEFDSECLIEPEGFGESETYPTDSSIGSLQKSLVEANILSEDQSQRVGPPENQQSEIDEDCRGFQESPIVEASGSSSTVSEDHRNINSQIESVEVQNQTKSEVGLSEPDVSAGVHTVLSDIESQSNKEDSGEAIGLSTMESEDQRNINSLIETVDIQDQTKPEVVSERDVSGGVHAVLSDTESESNEKDSGEANGSSTMDSEDHVNIISQIETGEAQDQMDEIKPEVGVSERDISDGVHVLPATESQSNKNESAAQGSEKSPAVKPYLLVDEERSHESHLEFSSSSSDED
ncbi:uncharacterized protein LOC141612271 [Silene latifolia]|uniref:uncharacterized protein LOC141612271 n=1 Tax=Silene latifolia TaxID=37657 RepID=UPI003D78527F